MQLMAFFIAVHTSIVFPVPVWVQP